MRSEGDFVRLEGTSYVVVSVETNLGVRAMELDVTLRAVVAIAVEEVVISAKVIGVLDRSGAELDVTIKALAGAARALDERGVATVVVCF